VEQILLGHGVGQSGGQTPDYRSLGGHSQLHQEDAGAHGSPVPVFVGSNQTGGHESSNPHQHKGRFLNFPGQLVGLGKIFVGLEEGIGTHFDVG